MNDENRENAPGAFFPASEAPDASVSPGPEAARGPLGLGGEGRGYATTGDPFELESQQAYEDLTAAREDLDEGDTATEARRDPLYRVRDRLAVQTSEGYFAAVVKPGTDPWGFLFGLPTALIGAPPTTFAKLEVEDPNGEGGTTEVMVRIGAIDSVQPVWR